MWWTRRPTKNPAQRMGKPPARGALRRAPWWGAILVLIVAAGIGVFLPLMGISLAAFVVVDFILMQIKAKVRDSKTLSRSTT